MSTVNSLRQNEVPRERKVPQVDSVEKIVSQLALISRGPVDYERTTFNYSPDSIYITPQFFHRFICKNGCTACCQKFTLDYLPWDHIPNPTGFEDRIVTVNGAQKTVRTNDQSENSLCDFLTSVRPAGGLGCSQWPDPPLSCASAPQIKFTQPVPRVTHLTCRGFNPAKWNLVPLPQCEFEPHMDSDDMENKLKLLYRFNTWAEYLSIITYLPGIIRVVEECMEHGPPKELIPV